MSTTSKEAPRWPGGHQFCVVVTVNLDAELALTGPDPALADMHKTLSVFRYGVSRGAPRLLRVFAERAVSSTWFVPGALVAEAPELLAGVVESGHELGARCQRLERLDGLAALERDAVLRASRAALRTVTDAEECGFRLPSGEWPPGLGAELLDAGFTWSSSWVGDDLPFFVPAGADRTIVDIPVLHAMDDRLAFAWNFAPPIPSGQSRIATYEEVLHNWLFELEGSRREGLCLVLQLHPEVTGTPGRVDLVSRFLDAALDADAWVATGSAVASSWSAARAPEAEHPLQLLRRVSPATLS